MRDISPPDDKPENEFRDCEECEDGILTTGWFKKNGERSLPKIICTKCHGTGQIQLTDEQQKELNDERKNEW